VFVAVTSNFVDWGVFVAVTSNCVGLGGVFVPLIVWDLGVFVAVTP